MEDYVIEESQEMLTDANEYRKRRGLHVVYKDDNVAETSDAKRSSVFANRTDEQPMDQSHSVENKEFKSGKYKGYG